MAFETEAEKKPYKWVKNAIESSDPYKDYEKIWRLSIEFSGGGDFIQNLIYATTFSNFIASEWGSEVVWRNDGGKVLHRATDRVYETQYHNSVWWYHGPHHPETQKSVDTINKRHAYYAKTYPGVFSHTTDYTYVLCFTAISVHRLRLRLHLPGFTEKQKLAAHIFWKEMAQLFLVEVPHRPLEEWKPLPTHEDFPQDWDEMYRYCEDFENNHMAVTDKGHMIAEALFDQFADRFFPPALRPLGRSIPITLSLPQTLKAHRIQPTNPILARIIIFLVGTFMWIMETFFPDPKISYQETLQLQLADKNQKKQTRKLDSGFPATFASNHQGAAAFCPFSVSTKKSD
ncbi:hypothetical protein N7494_000980 [Penicillium frequentans]|uniref:ER-bound oxygenase mpaB/mpaB'/Rubber oxygenase catalytic domain-containing protein n=1 Tax=Penicillium frequentans TaxID=3151616 RepID=A0AAD6D6T8_9EURO|nr:hypothetical protein N7494_000980 [Penicillium glabrum]